MKKRNLIFLFVLVVLAIFGVVFKKRVTAPIVPMGTQSAAPAFTWKFAEAKTNNPDGNPQTSIFLDDTLIDTSDGGCVISADATTKETDEVTGTGIIQCYYAGAGSYYKIVKSTTGYVVMKKGFEEGLPDYNPPMQEYKPFVEIPFN